MLHLESLPTLKQTLADLRRNQLSIGLVPTMGNLHAGHMSLVTNARRQCDLVVVSIFVNPLQFGPNEDFNRYPRTMAEDLAALELNGCDVVFTPPQSELYPTPLETQTRISVPKLSTLYCGKTRPGHFDGVCTIVSKLFNMVQPDVAFFGLKDFQQFFLISRMVADLQFPLRLVGLPTVREASGLAMSSRNGYLNDEERQQATAIYATLQHMARLIQTGEKEFPGLESQALAMLTTAGLRPEYFNIVDRSTLLPPTPDTSLLLLLTAAYAGQTRLIDNLALDLT